MSEISQIGDFMREVVGFPELERPTRLSPPRKEWFGHAAREELKEFEDAETLEDELDAVLDLGYFAFGRAIEMVGVEKAIAGFREVHRANMGKVRGELSKRPGAVGFDAIKPTGWVGPDLHRVIHDLKLPPIPKARALTTLFEDVPLEPTREPTFRYVAPRMSIGEMLRAKPRHPKIILLGHARHGKDTVAELLRDQHGLAFRSSSEFCAERILMPLFKEHLGITYKSVADCYADRVQWRKVWYDAITDFNTPDRTSLGRAILSEVDVYCGMRNAKELHACRIAGLADAIVWVDRSDHVGPEASDSCTVEPWMADYTLDNNGSLDDLKRGLETLMSRIHKDRIR